MRAAWYEHKGGPKESLVDGDLRSTIAARFPLERIAEAHELVEAGAPGRVLIEIRRAQARRQDDKTMTRREPIDGPACSWI